MLTAMLNNAIFSVRRMPRMKQARIGDFNGIRQTSCVRTARSHDVIHNVADRGGYCRGSVDRDHLRVSVCRCPACAGPACMGRTDRNRSRYPQCRYRKMGGIAVSRTGWARRERLAPALYDRAGAHCRSIRAVARGTTGTGRVPEEFPDGCRGAGRIRRRYAGPGCERQCRPHSRGRDSTCRSLRTNTGIDTGYAHSGRRYCRAAGNGRPQ